MIHHQKSECLVKKVRLLYSGSRSQWRIKMLMFVQMMSSKPPNILFPNLVLWCIIMSWSVTQKDWLAIFKVRVTARALMTKVWQFLLYLLNCWSFCYQARVFYGDIGLLCSRSRSEQNFKMSMNVCPDLFLLTEHFTTKLGMLMHQYEPDCLSIRLVCCLQGQGHS